MLTLIYTSGTTGPPKGVQITHANICETVRSYDQIIGFERGRHGSSPTCRWRTSPSATSATTSACCCGFTVTCCPDPREVAQYLPEVHPTWFFGVPRIFEKVKAGLEAMLAGLPEGEQKDKPRRARSTLSLQRVKLIQAGEPVPEELEQRWQAIDEQVLSNIRAMLGFDQLEALQRRRRADAARGDRVLPRARHPAGGAVGHVRDDRRRLPATRPSGSRSAPSARPRRASRSSSPRTARC